MVFNMIKCDICDKEYKVSDHNRIAVIAHRDTNESYYYRYIKDVCDDCSSAIIDTIRERWKNGLKAQGKTIDLDKFKEEFKW